MFEFVISENFLIREILFPRKCRLFARVAVAGGTKGTGLDSGEWARRCQEWGAGVISPTSMDGDGTLADYDLAFTRLVADAVDLPVIASGGGGKPGDFIQDQAPRRA